MREENKPSVRIIVRADGVDRVQLCGRSWDQEPEANKIYQQIAPLIRQIDRLLKAPAVRVTDSEPRSHIEADLKHQRMNSGGEQ